MTRSRPSLALRMAGSKPRPIAARGGDAAATRPSRECMDRSKQSEAVRACWRAASLWRSRRAGQAPQHVQAAARQIAMATAFPTAATFAPTHRAESGSTATAARVKSPQRGVHVRIGTVDRRRQNQTGSRHRRPASAAVGEGRNRGAHRQCRQCSAKLQIVAAACRRGRAYLTEEGVALSRITVVGRGASRPLADNRTPAGRAQNRRAVLRRTDCS